MDDLRVYEGFSLFCNNVPNHLALKTLTIPKMKEKNEAHYPGFGRMGINVGLVVEPFEMDFELVGDNPETLALFGYGPGIVHNFTAYQASKSRILPQASVNQTIIYVTGRILDVDEDTREAGKLSGAKYKISEISVYKRIYNGVVEDHYDIKQGGDILHRRDVLTALGL